VAGWLKQLGADGFRDREEAEARLRWVASHHSGRYATDLQAASRATEAAEVCERLTRVLAAQDRLEPIPEEFRAARGVEVLQRIATPAARAALAKLATSPAEAWLTRDARAALNRLEQVR
jgi:hypothetical protein